ncbi:MAG: hypothetical protein QOK29_5270, partial [Rhodospirillaceae bacterium]|nr:hypothetical protein [Rhodospirillaceae bacterium]
MARNADGFGLRGRVARIGLRVRLALAIAGISAFVAIASGLIVYQRVSVDRLRAGTGEGRRRR